MISKENIFDFIAALKPGKKLHLILKISPPLDFRKVICKINPSMGFFLRFYRIIKNILKNVSLVGSR